MASASSQPSISPTPTARSGIAPLMVVLAIAAVAGALLLLSPLPGETFPGAIPWADSSILKRIVDVLSLGGSVATARGVEIKDLVLHVAAALGLFLLAAQQWLRPAGGGGLQRVSSVAQVLLCGWVLLSLVSSLWAGDGDLARGQALLYAISLAWAVALAGTLARRDLPALAWGIAISGAVAGVLCVWYFHERNPYHRPGFPLGNPTTLAAALVPGLIFAAALVVDRVQQWRRDRSPAAFAAAGLALALLVPLVWAFLLARGRGAALALVIGGLAALAMLVSRRWRVMLGIVLGLGLLGAGLWWYNASHLDLTMARGATIRFRLYAWRYAAELWQVQPVLGHGAGSYPRLAGKLAVRDRALDPAAFMNDLIGHAHNELFEILTEIGLVGGVTFVGGLLATIMAGVLIARRRSGQPPDWLALALLASLVALLVDALTGVALRLPGVGVLFWTLVGLTWAASSGGGAAPPAAPVDRRARIRALLTGVVCVLAGIAVARLARQNWIGVQYERDATIAYRGGQYAQALTAYQNAEVRLLDSVRVITARERAVNCRYGAARAALAVWLEQRGSAIGGVQRDEVIRLADQAHDSARRLSREVPALPRTDALIARTAEWLAELHRDIDPQAARSWLDTAARAWQRQRLEAPYDVETLLALTRYPASLPDQLGLLRDALRQGNADGAWHAALERLAQHPQCGPTIAGLVAATGPLTPQTDVDSLLVSEAPEILRLAAAWHTLQGDDAQAAVYAGRAAELYRPLRVRLPDRVSIALGEQAEYVFRSRVDVSLAIALAQEAIAALPAIQTQKLDALVRPFRFRLALYLLADGRIDDALAQLELALGDAAAQPGVIAQLVARLYHDSAAGLTPEDHAALRTELCAYDPRFCPSTTSPGPAGDTD
jgi:O-antigen ligase